MSKRSKIHARNKSPSGWWWYNEIEQWVSDRQKKLTPGSRCLVWQNMRIIRAASREQAFEKAMRLGRQGSPSRTLAGEWRFAGISELMPIYDDLEDGAEIVWRDRGKLTAREIDKLVKSKKQLPVFDDTKRELD